MTDFFRKNSGFTLIELLVVVAIIGVLASVVLASLNTARERGRDARRLADTKQIRTALEMYYNDFGYYPKRDVAYTSSAACGGTPNWCSLKTDLLPYLSLLAGDPLGQQDNYRYYYDTDSADNFQTYGMRVRFESSTNSGLQTNDGGYRSDSYEFGHQPSYCRSKYAGASGDWWTDDTGAVVCVGGN